MIHPKEPLEAIAISLADRRLCSNRSRAIFMIFLFPFLLSLFHQGFCWLFLVAFFLVLTFTHDISPLAIRVVVADSTTHLLDDRGRAVASSWVVTPVHLD